VRRMVSVPEGVERIVERRSIVRSAFLRYRGSQLWRVSTDGVRGGEEGAGRGVDFSGEVSGAAASCISDILMMGTEFEHRDMNIFDKDF